MEANNRVECSEKHCARSLNKTITCKTHIYIFCVVRWSFKNHSYYCYEYNEQFYMIHNFIYISILYYFGFWAYVLCAMYVMYLYTIFQLTWCSAFAYIELSGVPVWKVINFYLNWIAILLFLFWILRLSISTQPGG